ncbi:NUDIX domain-containing protein [Candidatus Heimdallarchaeota archaeon]|nr:MAG: NUDIX domain-containing protein [Candidatus Heimdallarchaeota archaeon]
MSVSTPSTEGRFMVAVAAIIENRNGDILLIKRKAAIEPYIECWEDVGGRLKQSESPHSGLKREIEEETGLKDIEIVKTLGANFHYRNNERKPENEIIIISYWCKTTSSTVKLSNEHSSYRWLSYQNALELASYNALKNNLQIYWKEKQRENELIQ